MNNYRPQRSCGQGNIFTPVCHSVHGGGCLPQCMLGYHNPRSRHPPEQTPPEQTPPRKQTSPEGVDTPWKADSGIRSMSGRYASYWNAFLFLYEFIFSLYLYQYGLWCVLLWLECCTPSSWPSWRTFRLYCWLRTGEMRPCVPLSATRALLSLF